MITLKVEIPVRESLINEPLFDLTAFLKEEMVRAAQAHAGVESGGTCNQIDGPFDVSPSFSLPVEGRKIYTALVDV